MRKFIFLTTMKQTLMFLLLGAIVGTTALFMLVSVQPVAAQSPDSCDSVTEIPKSECEALVALYNSTDGDNWINKDGWLKTNTPCSWHGVSCGAGHVVHLLLGSNQLSGGISPELGNLIELLDIDLTNNQLSGSIPPEVGNLTNLIKLDLEHNQLNGNIPPELGNLANLAIFWLHHNQLSGHIPPELSNLANLTELVLMDNQLDGSIPSELGNLANLHGLNLHNNQLSGNIPPELGNLANLSHLYLCDNQLSGPLPVSLTNLTLEQFCFNNTNLCEPTDPDFQDWLDTIPSVQSTNVACGFCDSVMEIPKSECEALVVLYNRADGDNWINKDGWLKTSTPCSWYGVMCHNGHVIQLSLVRNQLSGSIPPEVGNLTNLIELNLEHNQLNGNIPPELGNLVNLVGLFLHDNLLEGLLPLSLTNLSQLTHFHFEETSLLVPSDEAFENWLCRIPYTGSTGVTCVYLGIQKEGSGTGTVTGDGIDCGANCSSDESRFSWGATVTLTATSDPGSMFSGWSGDCSGTDQQTTVTMNADKSCIATFSIPRPVEFYYEAIVHPGDPILWQGRNLREDPRVGDNPYWLSGKFGWDTASADGDVWLSRVAGFPIFEPEDLWYQDATILDNVPDDDWMRYVDVAEIDAYFGPSEVDLLGWIDLELKYRDDVWSSSSLPMDLSMDGLLVGQIKIGTFDNLNYVHAEITNLQTIPDYVIPEPATVVLLGSGILILAGLSKLRRTAK